MPKDRIKHKKDKVNHAVCNGGSLYLIDLDNKAQAAVFGNPGDVFEFTRIGQDNNAGFRMTFNHPVINEDGGQSGLQHEVQGSSTLNIGLPAATPGTGFYYKYTISYPFDAHPGCILELDPVIIIEPSKSLHMTYAIAGVGIGAVGATVACMLL